MSLLGNRLLFAGSFISVVASLTIVSSVWAGEPFRLVGYLPDNRMAEFDPDAARLLTDLVVFSAVPTAAGELDLSRLSDAVGQTARLQD